MLNEAKSPSRHQPEHKSFYRCHTATTLPTHFGAFRLHKQHLLIKHKTQTEPGVQTARTGVKKHLCPVEIPEKQASAAWNLNKNSGLRAAVWREREVTCEIV